MPVYWYSTGEIAKKSVISMKRLRVVFLGSNVHGDDFNGQILSKLYLGEIKCVSLYLAQALWEDILAGDWHKRAWCYLYCSLEAFGSIREARSSS